MKDYNASIEKLRKDAAEAAPRPFIGHMPGAFAGDAMEEQEAEEAREEQEEADFRRLREKGSDLTPAEEDKLREYLVRMKMCELDSNRVMFDKRETMIYGKAFLAIQHELEFYSKANGIDLVINDDQATNCPTSLASVTTENTVSLANRHVLISASNVDITSDILQRLKSQH